MHLIALLSIPLGSYNDRFWRSKCGPHHIHVKIKSVPRNSTENLDDAPPVKDMDCHRSYHPHTMRSREDYCVYIRTSMLPVCTDADAFQTDRASARDWIGAISSHDIETRTLVPFRLYRILSVFSRTELPALVI
jgi:hypothetical protein